VVAKPDEKWGETPCAFVELKPGANATAEELMACCRSHLAAYKCPRYVVFAEIPKTSTGKLQKFKAAGCGEGGVTLDQKLESRSNRDWQIKPFIPRKRESSQDFSVLQKHAGSPPSRGRADEDTA